MRAGSTHSLSSSRCCRFPSGSKRQEAAFKPFTTRSVAANRIAERPDYAHVFSDDVNWLDFGLESRTRYEYRWNDYSTPGLVTDDALVTRNLLYLGIRNALDPLRFTVELEDSRRFLSDRIDNPNIENRLRIPASLRATAF